MKLPPRFIPYAESLGVRLLKDDLKFIEKTLSKCPQNRHRSILSDYLLEYTKVLGFEIERRDGPAKHNKARYAANTWLRKHTGNK